VGNGDESVEAAPDAVRETPDGRSAGARPTVEHHWCQVVLDEWDDLVDEVLADRDQPEQITGRRRARGLVATRPPSTVDELGGRWFPEVVAQCREPGHQRVLSIIGPDPRPRVHHMGGVHEHVALGMPDGVLFDAS